MNEPIVIEKTARDIAREFMLGEVMAAAMKQLRAIDKPWLRMPEAAQKDVIEQVKADVRHAITQAVEIWLTFARLRGSWLRRANGSNLAGAAVDSLVFPTLAFGALMPHIVALQFIAKVSGGAIWTWLLSQQRTAQEGAGNE